MPSGGVHPITEDSKAWQVPALPTVTKVPVTATSRPFLSAAAEMEAAGYVEEEFFLTGQANVYEWDGTTGKVKVVAGPGAYTNRILVRRPKDPARFSGKIEVNLLNATTLVDRGSPLDFERMVAESGAWVGLTTKSLTASTLKKFDPQRYASLNWPNPAPESQRCSNPSIVPLYTIGNISPAMMPPIMRDTTQEDGLVWDMIGQLGLLLKSGRRGEILPGFAEPKLFMTGISQSALMINTWLVGFHGLYRTASGMPAYDGYLPIVGANLLRISQCSRDVPVADPRNQAPLLDVPIIKMYSEAEMNYGRITYRPDIIKSNSGVVTYEVAGAPHSRSDIPGRPRKIVGGPAPAEVARALAGVPAMPRLPLPAGQVPNDYPWAPALRGALYHLEQWSVRGIAPPRAPRITLDATLKVVRDEHGNALGGLRLAYIDVPIARYRGAVAETGWGSITGAKVPFDKAKLAALYPTHDEYMRKFSAVTDRNPPARFVMASDADAMKAAAADADIP
jgi:hypothetical protein